MEKQHLGSAEPMRCVRTKYVGPSNTKPGRVIATHVNTGKRKIIQWDCELDVLENHALAAFELLGGYPQFVSGDNGAGYVFMRHPREGAFVFEPAETKGDGQ